MGTKHYTKAELMKRKRANALINEIDKASKLAALIPGPYIKNESLKVFEETIQAYNNLEFHFLTDMDKPILEAYADAVAYWRFYKTKKDEALSKLNKNHSPIMETFESEEKSYTIAVDEAATIAYCEKMIEIYFKRMIAAREHLSLNPIQLAKFIKAMQEINESNKKKEEKVDPIEDMFGNNFKPIGGDEQ